MKQSSIRQVAMLSDGAAASAAVFRPDCRSASTPLSLSSSTKNISGAIESFQLMHAHIAR
jgi:hypothetical protein